MSCSADIPGRPAEGKTQEKWIWERGEDAEEGEVAGEDGKEWREGKLWSGCDVCDKNKLYKYRVYIKHIYSAYILYVYR